MKRLNSLALSVVLILLTACAHEPRVRSGDRVLLIGNKVVYEAKEFDQRDVSSRVSGHAEITLTHISASRGMHNLKLTVDNQSSHPLICVYRPSTNQCDYVLMSEVIQAGSMSESVVTFVDPAVALFGDSVDIDPDVKKGMVSISCIKSIPFDFRNLETIDAVTLMNNPENYNNRYLKVEGQLSYLLRKCGFYQEPLRDSDGEIKAYVSVRADQFPSTPTDMEIHSVVTGLFTFYRFTKQREINHVSSVEFFPKRKARGSYNAKDLSIAHPTDSP